MFPVTSSRQFSSVEDIFYHGPLPSCYLDKKARERYGNTGTAGVRENEGAEDRREGQLDGNEKRVPEGAGS